jgi:hypothetical protein
MNQISINEQPRSHTLVCSDAITMAEHELTAFFRTVTELFGSSLAELSAEDWLHELATTDILPTSSREWRRITLNVSTQLAARVNAGSTSNTITNTCISTKRLHR